MVWMGITKGEDGINWPLNVVLLMATLSASFQNRCEYIALRILLRASPVYTSMYTRSAEQRGALLMHRFALVVSAKTPVFDSFERCKQYRHPVVSEVFMKAY